MAYSVCLIGLLAIKILARGFYAKQDIRTPVRIAVFVLVLTQCLNLILVPYFAHAGLALSIGLGATVNAVCLLVLLQRHKLYRPGPGWLKFGLRILPALLAMSAVRSEEHTSELQSLMRNSYAVFCLKKKKTNKSSDN